MLLRVLGVLITAYLAFFCYVAAHEWAGHLLADSLVFARHGSHARAFEVVVQWLDVRMADGDWTAALAPFRIGGEVISAVPDDQFTLTAWETGFGNIMGSGITTLISLIVLIALNLRKSVRRFPWLAIMFVLCSVIFDQILYTFVGADPEPLVSAVLMGANALLFKGLVIGLVLLQAGLLIRFVLLYRRSRRPPTMRP